ncbi:hypothetical protein RGQ13_08660 [Thalassotalea psychrophila]|uniref:Uncharacterized protein n=1 Tax=Thalassotalea psychrophila TaxID=3065647 RepID=A0ABY9TZP8_9GAMM|nr:hypothetical protein RGQ13_08660 [Colwelliaceae bacterium SQ149]
MSSREEYISIGPSNGNYEHKSVPAQDQDIPAFLSDEFLQLGSIVNGILEGGAFPPQTEMPKRYREGMMFFFSQPIEPTNETTITSAGVWLYRNKKWWKVIDDPSSIEGVTLAYRLTTDETSPSTPPDGVDYPPTNWEQYPPVKGPKTDWIWVSSQTSIAEDGTRTWSSPTPWSAGVTDGVSPPAIPGHRAVVQLTDPVLRSSFSTRAAYDLVVAEVSDRDPIVPINGDTVTQHSSIPTEEGEAPTFIATKSYQVGSGNPGIWEDVAEFIDGNLVVNGTINGGAIRADSEVRIGGNAGDDLVVVSATDPNSRLWVGDSGDGATANFRVSPSGDLFANSGVFNGSVQADNITGDVLGIATHKSPVQYIDYTLDYELLGDEWTVEVNTAHARTMIVTPPLMEKHVSFGTNTELQVALQADLTGTGGWVTADNTPFFHVAPDPALDYHFMLPPLALEIPKDHGDIYYKFRLAWRNRGDRIGTQYTPVVVQLIRQGDSITFLD